MKFRTKIKLSFIVLTIIPILAMAVVLFYIGTSQLRSMERKYGVDDIGIESI